MCTNLTSTSTNDHGFAYGKVKTRMLYLRRPSEMELVK